MFPISTRGRGKLASRTAMAIALALGTAGGAMVLAAPAVAKEAKQAPPQLSKEFRALAAPLQTDIDNALKSKDAAAAAALKPKLEAALAGAQTPDDKLIAGQLAIRASTFSHDKVIERRGLESALASGKLPAAEAAKYNFFLGVNAYDSKDFATARTAFGTAIAAGYTENDVEVLLAETNFADNQPQAGFEQLSKAIEAKRAAGQVVPVEWYGRGLSIAYRGKMYDKALVFSTGMVEAYPSKDNWADAIGVARTAGKYQAQETLDLMRLMGRTQSFRDTSDYAEYLQAADARRSPGEVLKVLDQGVKAGKLQAGEVFVSENRTVANGRLAADKASLPALERDARAPSAAVATIMAAGDAFLSYDDAAKAEGFYQAALSKPAVDKDRALTRLGIAQADQGKYADAQATFGKVGGVRKPIAQLWAIYAGQKAKGG